MTRRAPGLLAGEFRWLPELGPRLTLPVPVPLRLSEPSDLFPRPWAITTWVPGEPADRTEISDVGRTVANLVRFLHALHRPTPDDVPANPGRSGSLTSLADVFESRLALVADVVDVRGVRRVWDEAAGLLGPRLGRAVRAGFHQRRAGMGVWAAGRPADLGPDRAPEAEASARVAMGSE